MLMLPGVVPSHLYFKQESNNTTWTVNVLQLHSDWMTSIRSQQFPDVIVSFFFFSFIQIKKQNPGDI